MGSMSNMDKYFIYNTYIYNLSNQLNKKIGGQAL